MKHCVAIRHVAFEDLGFFADVLAARAFTVEYVEAGWDDLAALDPLGADLMVILGGPIGVYDVAEYPFLADEIRLIERRLAASLPLVGICLGAQLMARALGARVYPNPNGKEIGWGPLALTEAGTASCLAPLDGVPVLHWHGDTFDLPEGAELLASTAVARQQAFRVGRHGLGLQFHLEVTAHGLERWYIGHAAEIGATAGLDVATLRAASARHGPAIEAAGRRALESWLDAF
ncbi:MAG: glutamine amidotransferase [Magnetospirillum sp.]|nr:glutamine amidotransferase [Magnetospirillum sp.]